MPRNVTRGEFDQAVEAVWTEIQYQNRLPRRGEDEASQVPAFCVLLRQYVYQCEADWAFQAATEQPDGQLQCAAALHGLRKLAGIAVRGMIYNGVRDRK